MEAGLKAIAEPRRQEILRLVWSQERPAGEIAAHFDVSRPAISKHLRVEMRRFLESFWDERLLSIKQAAEAESRHTRGR